MNDITRLMKDEVWAKYRNDLYGLDFVVEYKQGGRMKLRSFTTLELRILMAVIYAVDGESDTPITIPIERIRELTGLRYGSNTRLRQIMHGAQEALASLKFKGESEKASGTINIFNFAVATEVGVTCRVNNDALYLFNNLFDKENGGYSQIMLSMVNHLNKYEIMLAMRLVHYRNIVDDQTRKHVYRTRLEDFVNWMNVPSSYNFMRLNENIIQPAIKKLSRYFLGLSMEKIKTGKTVTGLAFWYDAVNDTGSNLISVEDAEPF